MQSLINGRSGSFESQLKAGSNEILTFEMDKRKAENRIADLVQDFKEANGNTD